MIYVTDGSFEGILAAVFEAFRNREDPEEITLGGDFQLSIAAGIGKFPPTPGSQTGSGAACRTESRRNPLRIYIWHI